MFRRRIVLTMATMWIVAGLAIPTALAQPGRAAGGQASALTRALDDLPMSALSQEEIAGIQWMREEEKLARDVYRALAERYALPVFTNIAASEQDHMNAVGALLERYGIADPAAGKAAGAFVDPELQKLYDSLLAQGEASLASALRVGATIEETDIADLRARATPAPDVALVYDALERGSENHLRAFTRLVERVSGAPYAPQLLSKIDYDRIRAGR